jgi:acetyl-CoA synthetase/medium-chain acyl-CoA synthetase
MSMSNSNKAYQQMIDDFSWDRPEYFNFATDVIDRWASDTPDSTALWWTDGEGQDIKLSYLELARSSKQFCNVLQDAGLKKGDLVLMVMKPQPEWWVIVTACLRMGLVVSPGSTQLHSNDIDQRLEASEAACVIADADNAPKFDAIEKNYPSLQRKIVAGETREGWINYEQAMADARTQFEPEPTLGDDVSMCYFTSGTTGYPKMVLHTQASYGIGHIATGHYWLRLKPAELMWCITDTGWAKAAYSAFFGPMIQGATIFSLGAALTPVKVLQILQDYPIDVLCGAPTIYRMLVQQDLSQYSINGLKRCYGAGEPLNPEIISAWQAYSGLAIAEGYGQTETCILCASWEEIEMRPGSMGKAAPGYDLQVVSNEGEIVEAGEEGEIAVRVKGESANTGPVGLFKEYWKSPERMAESFRGDWYFTGDRAVRDEDGYFWFLSRSDDVIISSGYRIGPFEVESALIEHPAVAESAVVSSPDETRGEVVKAFIVLADGYKGSDELTKEIQIHVKSVTAPFKYPRKIEYLDELPKTVSGKIRRVELRAKEWT